MASVTPGLYRLVDAVSVALAEGDGTADQWSSAPVAENLDAALRDALEDPDLLPREIVSGTPRFGFGTCLLFSGPSFTLFSSVTAPKARPPVHDHGSWGIVGVYRGIEEEIRFDRVGAATDAPSPLVEVDRSSVREGDLVRVGPPPSDVHQVLNRGGKNSVAIHLFRHDLAGQGFSVYEEPGFRRVPTGRIAYDSVLTTER